MRLPSVLVLACLLILAFSMMGWPARNVRALSQTASTVSISTVGTCCVVVNSYFTINIILNLAPGESINGFDVRINYTKAFTNQNPGVLQAASVNYDQNIFSGGSTDILVDCIDGVTQPQAANGCPTDDSTSPGQVHLIEALLGATISSGGRLFSIAFKVTGTGTSVFTVDRANIINPYGDPSNPQLIDSVFIPVVKRDGIFGNIQGAVPFFNYQPNDTSLSPAVLPNQEVDFDASASFAGYNLTLGFKQFTWSFGDGSAPTSGVKTTHIFPLPGNYTVTLTGIDNNNEAGTISRIVNVHSALGNILLTLKNQMGTTIQGGIAVHLFNTSSSGAPFVTKLITVAGEVQFNGLSPSDTYYLTFSGQGYDNMSKTESVKPGWTTMDTIYLNQTPPPPDYSGFIYIGSILGALGAVTALIVYKTRSNKNETSRRSTRPTSAKPSRKTQ
jgi:hypothetical protein